MRVFNKTDKIKHVGSVSLNIGANKVDDDAWNEVKEHPIVKHWIKKKDIEVQDGDLEDISKITPVEKAIEVIKSTFSQEKLQKYKKDETRKTAIAAIDDQLEYLNKKDK